MAERWAWKPKSPLHLLLLRSHSLPNPVTLPYRPEYGGCRSWISLAEPISVEGSHPVLSETAYQQRVEDVLDTIGLKANSVPQPN